MRISTLQMHHQSLNAMQRQQARAQQTELQIASGMRIMKPSDDPVGAVRVLNLGSNISTIKQYDRNIAQAQSSLSYQENILGLVGGTLQRIRELTIQGNSPANHSTARAAIAQEINQHLESLKTLANTRDASGEYIFSGFRVDAPPFVDNAGVVSYQGDQGQRFVQIGEGARVAIRDPGDRIFMHIPGGDGEVEAAPGSSNTGALVVTQFGVTGNLVPTHHTVTFAQADPDAPITYEVTDNQMPPNVVASGPYVPGNTLNIGGAHVTLNGTPDAGDTVEIRPAQPADMFSMVARIATALGNPGETPEIRAQLQNALTQGLANLDQSLETVSNQRATIGARLANADSIDNINQDLKLQLEGVLSATQDLDYAEAITRFNLQLTALQAAQQAYVKTTDLSLFQYL